MNTHIGKEIRIGDFIESTDGRSLLLDTSIAASLGATRGLENLSAVLQVVNEYFDGIIVNPGQAEKQAEYLGGKFRAAQLIRVDWTNAYRSQEFCLPVSVIKRMMISNGQDALDLGASAVVATLLMGYDEELESENVKSMSLLARECYRLALPVIADIQPIGGNVKQNNYADSVKLAVSFMLEVGADVLIIPEIDIESFKFIGDWITVPVIVRMQKIPREDKVKNIFKAGLSGVLLSEQVLTEKNLERKIVELKNIIHKN